MEPVLENITSFNLRSYKNSSLLRNRALQKRRAFEAWFNTLFRTGLWHPRYKSNPLSPRLNSYSWKQGSRLILGSFPHYTPPLPEPQRQGREQQGHCRRSPRLLLRLGREGGREGSCRRPCARGHGGAFPKHDSHLARQGG